MRKVWIIVALVVTLGITLGGVGTALAIGDPAPAPAPPLEGQSLCWIVGEVTAGGENSITVEGVKVKKVVEDGSVSFERIEGTFTVMVNDETQYRFGNQTRFGNQNGFANQNQFGNQYGFANQNRFENQYGFANQNRFENTKYRVPDDREPSLEGVLNGDRVAIAAQELENGSLLAKRVVVTPGDVRVIRLRNALLVMNREREMMALAIPQMRIVIIAKPLKIVPLSELPFEQELLPLELPSLLEPQ